METAIEAYLEARAKFEEARRGFDALYELPSADAGLVEGAQRRFRAAHWRLLDCQERLRLFVMRMAETMLSMRFCGSVNGYEAEDVAQEVVASFLSQGPVSGHSGACYLWLEKALRNKLVDQIRKEERRIQTVSATPSEDADWLDSRPDPSAPPPDAALFDAEMREDFRAALNLAHESVRQSPRFESADAKRWVFEMRRIHLHSCDEIRAQADSAGFPGLQAESDANLDQHATRYRNQLVRQVECGKIPEPQRSIVATLVLLTGESGRRPRQLSGKSRTRRHPLK